MKNKPLTAQERKWAQRFLALASTASQWSKDPSTKVGAVIADQENRVISLGYNGFPRFVSDKAELLADRETKLRLTIHAEENALFFAKRDVTGMSIYITHPPCSLCAAKLIQNGISNIFTYTPSIHFQSRWAESIALAEQIIVQGNARIHYLTPPSPEELIEAIRNAPPRT